MTIVQFTRFRVTPDREPAVLGARQDSLAACRVARAGLRACYLIRLADGEWLDVTVWSGTECGQALQPEAPAARAGFFSQLDELLGEECGVLVDGNCRRDDPAGRRHPEPGRLLRRGWPGIAQAAAIAAIAAGAAAAIYAERATMRAGVAGLAHLSAGWLIAGITAECVSMTAFAQLQRGLLRAVGAAPTLRSVLATAYAANAIAVSVPVAGSGMATAYAYREFRRQGAAPGQAGLVLTAAGIVSTVAFAVLAAAGALITGNPAAAVAGAGGVVAAAAVCAVLLSLRVPRARAWLQRPVLAVLRAARRITGRPRTEPGELVTRALAGAAALRLGWRASGQAAWWALVNWTADVACLACAISSVGGRVPWRDILLIWSAGVGAASFSPVPAGLGVVDIVLITALAGAGLAAPRAVAAVLLYRIITFKIIITVAWLTYYYLNRHRAGAYEDTARQAASP